jgi:DNA-directed RNA polymerase specialized sigma24 family protein
MKTTNDTLFCHRISSRIRTPEEEHRDSFRDLVSRASRGDRNAVLAINFAFRGEILEQARRVLGPFGDDDEDVLQDFLLTLLAGSSPYEPECGPPRTWMRRSVRNLARRQRAFRGGHSVTPPTEPPEE